MFKLLIDLIIAYLNDNGIDTKKIRGKIILEEIASQKGIFVERASDVLFIFSFNSSRVFHSSVYC